MKAPRPLPILYGSSLRVCTCRRGAQGVGHVFFEAARRTRAAFMRKSCRQVRLFHFRSLAPPRIMAGPKPSSQTLSALCTSYMQKTPDRLKFIDAFLTFIVLSGVLQFAYCVLVTNFPFNAFLAGYAVAVVGCVFWLTGRVGSRARSDSLCSPRR